jgi:V8-like Glu-specific endopeptidase
VIDPAILQRLRHGVCAVGYLHEPLADARPHSVAGWFTVVGSGFLVRKETVITNRHVLDNLESETKRQGIPETQRFLLFVVVRAGRVYVGSKPGTVVARDEVRITPRQVRRGYSLRCRDVDIALVEFAEVQPEHFASIEPVELDDPRSMRVSEPIAVYGYPHGNTLLEKDGRVHRWGPVLQQGWISGIAPWEGLAVPEEFLLDVRTADGISGSPVFRPSTGKVCGVLHSEPTKKRDDAVTTTAFAQPLSRDLLATWLAELDLSREPESADAPKSRQSDGEVK